MKKTVSRLFAAMMVCVLCMTVVTPVQAASKKKVTISMNGATMNAGSSRSLGVKVNTKSSLSCKTSNSKVLTVKNGKLTAKQPGTAKITVTASPKSKNYTKTSKSVSVKVIPAKPGTPTAKRSGKTVTASAKKVKYASGYQFQYASDKKMSGAKSKTVKSPSFSVSASGSKTWYVRVRAYTKVGKTNYYSGWSGIRSISACKHTWDKGKTTKKATCKAAGTKTYTCTKCKSTKTSSLAKKEHAWNIHTVNPTCYYTGMKSYVCANCGATKKETLPKKSHKWNSGKITRQPTCGDAGEKTYTCSVCGETKTESIPETGDHQMEKYGIDYFPTADKEGSLIYCCSKCGFTQYVPIPAAVSKYTYSVHILNRYKIYSEDVLVIYIKTDNPDPDSIYVTGDISAHVSMGAFVDVKYTKGEEAEHLRSYIDAVDGGYIATVYPKNVGTNVIEIYEEGTEYEEDFGMTYTYRVASSEPFQVYDYDDGYEGFVNEIMTEAARRTEQYPGGTPPKERILSEACDYVRETCTYRDNYNGRYVNLLSNQGTFWEVRQVDSLVGPSLIMDIGKRLGIEGLTHMSGDMHAYVKYQGADQEWLFCMTPPTSTGTIDPETIKMFDFSVYK